VSESLRRLQENFQGYLLTPDARMHPHVHGSAQVSAEERLAIYANAYRLRLLEALGTDYPACTQCWATMIRCHGPRLYCCPPVSAFLVTLVRRPAERVSVQHRALLAISGVCRNGGVRMGQERCL